MSDEVDLRLPLTEPVNLVEAAPFKARQGLAGLVDADHGPDRISALGAGEANRPFQQQRCNTFLLQVNGRCRIQTASPLQTMRLRRREATGGQDRELLPAYEIALEQGDALFLPVGWWWLVTAAEASVVSRFERFPWANPALRSS